MIYKKRQNTRKVLNLKYFGDFVVNGFVWSLRKVINGYLTDSPSQATKKKNPYFLDKLPKESPSKKKKLYTFSLVKLREQFQQLFNATNKVLFYLQVLKCRNLWIIHHGTQLKHWSLFSIVGTATNLYNESVDLINSTNNTPQNIM